MPHQTAKPLTTIEALKLRVLKVLLFVGTFALVGFWLTELKTGVLGPFDAFAYPSLIVFYGLLTVFLYLRPDYRRMAEIVTVYVMASYFVVAHWVFFISPDWASLDQLSLQQSRIVQWYILIFIAAFVFYEIKAAIITSIVFYLAIALPELIFLFDGAPERAQDVTATTVISLISNPVYIVCLWGVSLIKEHAYELSGHAEIMAEAASRDSLTGVLNRRGIAKIIAEFQHAPQNQDKLCALILFDVDHFKAINDTFGHDRGDETLRDLVKLTQARLRPSDNLARWGGEEFLVVAPDLSLENTIKLAERLRKDLVEANKGVLENVTSSYGISRLHPEESFEDAIKRADEALYQAKSSGRNCVRHEPYPPEAP